MNSSSLRSWTEHKNYQPIDYPNLDELEACTNNLSQQTPFISQQEILLLKKLIAEAGAGNIFIIQGGDCAEVLDAPLSYSNATATLINQLCDTIQSQLGIETIAIGRIAGQFAKPRSNIIDTNCLPNYRGDMINQAKQCQIARKLDPTRMLKAFTKSKQIHTMLSRLPQKKSFSTDIPIPNIFTSHEAYNLYYESACTKLGDDRKWYNLSAHLPWVGIKTKQIDGAHIEYISHINNPIAIKIDSSTTPSELEHLINKINPENTPGRISLITRLGKNQAHLILPDLIKYIQQNNLYVTWICDPMHGNIKKQAGNKKIRLLDDIQTELLETSNIHKQHDSILAGIHLECTMENVQECIATDQEQLHTPLVDPRLNKFQSHTLISKFAEHYNGR